MRTVTLASALLALFWFNPGQAKAVHVNCGDTITEDTTLDSDLIDCRDRGIIIGADKVRLALNGHTINGSRVPPAGGFSVGVDNGAGHDKVTIEDGTIYGFQEGVRIGDPVQPAHHNVVRRIAVAPCHELSVRLAGSNNRIENSSFGCSEFSMSVRGDANTISGNEMFSGHECVSFRGDDNLIEANTFDCDTAIGGGGSRNRLTENLLVNLNRYGIGITSGPGTVIDRNTVANAGGLGPGILVSNSEGIRIERNVLIGLNISGIRATDSDGSWIERNVVSNADESGIEVSGSDRSVIRSNRVSSAGLYDGHGISIAASNDVRIEANLLHRNFSLYSRESDALFVSESSSRALVARNTASGSRDDGIDVDSRSTTLTGNTADGNGDFGIDVVPGVIDGGGNKASDNGNPLQCLNVVCKGRPICTPDAGLFRFGQQELGRLDGAPSDLTVADFDNSHSPDIAVVVHRGFEPGGVQLVLNRPTGFELGPIAVAGSSPYSIDAGDVDGDGDLDPAVPNSASGDVAAFANDGAGNLQALPRLAAPYGPRGIAVTDYNGDGRADIAVTSADQPEGRGHAALRVFYRAADNTGFGPAVTVPPASVADRFQPMETLAAADLDGDGLTDIAGVRDGLFVSYRKPDDSAFAPVTNALPIVGGPSDVAADDLNGDGLTDLVAANGGAGPPPIAVILRRPDNSGIMPVQYLDVIPREYGDNTGGAARAAIADIDGDGRSDVVVSLLDIDKVAVILRCGNNRGFEPPQLFDAGDAPLALGAADMDADGDMDLVVGNRDSQAIRLLLNQGQTAE